MELEESENSYCMGSIKELSYKFAIIDSVIMQRAQCHNDLIIV